MTLARRTSNPPAGAPVAEVSDLGRTRRSAFTLIELLVVITIIGILAALAMAVMFSAQEAARRSRTEGLIGVLSNQMAFRWETYRTRRLPTNSLPDQTGAYDLALQALTNPSDIQQTAAVQLIARRQLMRIELPDRWYDVAFDDDSWTPVPPTKLTAFRDSAFTPPTNAAYEGDEPPASPVLRSVGSGTAWASVDRWSPNLILRTSLSYAYQRRYQQAIQQKGTTPTSIFQGAECLYMILTTGMGDESTGGGTFNQRDFADVDDDGMPEFIDGWGRPIGFLRWAPGFRSDMQSGDPINDHDPLDPRKADPIAFRLFPLIYSAGPDGAAGDDGTNSPFGIESHSQDPSSPPTHIDYNDPYAPAPASSGGFKFRGEPLEETAGIGPNDNIFNQALQIR